MRPLPAKRGVARAGIATLLAFAATSAWPQYDLAQPRAKPAPAPWLGAYGECTDASLARDVADKRTPTPTPEQVVVRAEEACIGHVPLMAGMAPADAATVKADLAKIHDALMDRLQPTRARSTLASIPPPRPAETMSPGRGITCKRPSYPQPALRAGAEGTTWLRVRVDSDGNIQDVTITTPSGTMREHRLLDEAALEAFRTCRFPPAADGQPQSLGIVYTWRLD